MPGEITSRELASRIEGIIATSETIRAAEEVRAVEVRDYWVSISPHWGDHDPKGATTPTEDGSGKIVDAYEDEYANSIHVESRPGKVRVGSKTKIAVFVEYGTSHIQEYACAARTAEHFNGEVTERTVNSRGQMSRPSPVGRIDLTNE